MLIKAIPRWNGRSFAEKYSALFRGSLAASYVWYASSLDPGLQQHIRETFANIHELVISPKMHIHIRCNHLRNLAELQIVASQSGLRKDKLSS